MTAVAPDGEHLVAVSRPADGVALVLLNRPHRRNALSRELLALLVDAFTRLRVEVSKGEVRAVVVTGAGTAFCAGLDLTEVAEQGPPDVRELDVVTALTSVGAPVIGAVNGPAVTGGLEIALACDFLVAGESARFADTHARVGIVPGWGLTARLPLAVGQGWARQMSATGDYVDARTAERIGLVNSVVPDSRLLDTALRLAGSAATVDPHVLATVRILYDATAEEGAGASEAGERAIWERGEAVGDQEAVASRRLAVLERGRGQLAGGVEDET